jgi:hypothetical protein
MATLRMTEARHESKRRWDRENPRRAYKQAWQNEPQICPECRQARRSRGAAVCNECHRRAEREAVQVRYREIARRWEAGELARQIAAALDTTPGSITGTIVRMRKLGFELERRAVERPRI